MSKKISLVLLLCMHIYAANAGNKIKYYFNQPVDTTVAKGINAVYLNHTMDDTLIAYINRSKYSLDIAQYNYSQSSSFSDIATAVNNAYSRGVKVRWIYDGSSTNSGLSQLNTGIYTLGSPTSNSYGIMHNKFVIIDANSSSDTDAFVWTGSPDWSSEQFNYDYNNVIVLQDSALAHVYTKEFNMMWGDTGVVPNSSAALFGPDKTDLGRHSFVIDGKQIELYFSPSDGTNSYIETAISTANTDLYFGMYTFTESPDASLIVSKKNAGIYIAGIVDEYSTSFSAYNTLNNGLGTASLKVYNQSSSIYHNKYLLVDPSNICSDPLVLTGSHNWTTSADTKNDENTLIIHDDTAANIYYQAFYSDFTALGGQLVVLNGCPTEVKSFQNVDDVLVYPNPGVDFTLSYHLNNASGVTVSFYNELGECLYTPLNNAFQVSGTYNFSFSPAKPGFYFVKIVTNQNIFIKKFLRKY